MIKLHYNRLGAHHLKIANFMQISTQNFRVELKFPNLVPRKFHLPLLLALFPGKTFWGRLPAKPEVKPDVGIGFLLKAVSSLQISIYKWTRVSGKFKLWENGNAQTQRLSKAFLFNCAFPSLLILHFTIEASSRGRKNWCLPCHCVLFHVARQFIALQHSQGCHNY